MAVALHPQPRPIATYRPRPVVHPATRVYARRRAVVSGICAAVIGLLIGGGVFARSAGAERPTVPTGGIEMPHTVVAVQGDTLWAIAHRLAPQGDVMDLVDRLVELNGADIRPGQVIRIP